MKWMNIKSEFKHVFVFILSLKFIFLVFLYNSYLLNKDKDSAISVQDAADAEYYPTFVRTVFIVSSMRENIRVISVQRCTGKQKMRNLKIRIDSKEIEISNKPIVQCPWFYAPQCDFVGVLGVGSYHTPIHNLSAEVETNDGWKAVDIIDTRQAPPQKHQLGVCLQPIYMMADWTLIPHFFETWISQGATYFIIYYHSMSVEFASMLNIYLNNQKQFHIELVQWSLFPLGNFSDVNAKTYRTEVAAAINDCILRAKNKVTYLASADMDEILSPLSTNISLTQLLQNTEKMHKEKSKLNIGAFMFLNSFAAAKTNWSKLRHPRELVFDGYKKISLQEKVWSAGSRSKVIMRPEYVYLSHVHSVLRYEVPGVTTAILPKHVARVLHFRQIGFDYNLPAEELSIFSEKIDLWNHNYKSRFERRDTENLLGLSLLKESAFPWPNRGKEILKEIDSCREKNMLRKNLTCDGQSCLYLLNTVRADEFLRPENSWVTV